MRRDRLHVYVPACASNIRGQRSRAKRPPREAEPRARTKWRLLLGKAWRMRWPGAPVGGGGAAHARSNGM